MTLVHRSGNFSSTQSKNQSVVTIEQPKVDGVVPPLNLWGMAITGVDPRLISELQFSLNVPLMRGLKKCTGTKRKVKLEIKKDTTAFVAASLSRDEKGHLSLGSFSIYFSHSVTVKNPASSLRNKGHHKNEAIIDKIADVKIKSILLDDTGIVYVNGKIRAFHMFGKKLPNIATKLELPNIEEAFLNALGLIGSTKMDAHKSKISQFDIKKVLKQLGAMSKQASYEIKVKGDKARMSFLKDNTLLRGAKSPLNIELKGVMDLDRFGDLFFTIDGIQSKIKCSVGTYSPDIEASIHNLGEKKPVTFDIFGNVSGNAHNLQVDTFSKTAVKNMLPRQKKHVPIEMEGPSNNNQFNASMGTKSLNMKGHIDVQSKAQESIRNAKGSLALEVDFHKPYGKTEERGIIMDGKISADLVVDEFTCQERAGLKNAKGAVDLAIHPSKDVVAKFPEIKSVNFPYKFELSNLGYAKITPPEYGVTRFVRPVINLEGHFERIDGSLTKGPLYPIGSKDYFKHIYKITGAKIRNASKVRLLIDGTNSMPERLRLINEAKDYICFQTLVFKDDESGWQYAEALAAAAKRGVRVYGIVDSLGNIESLKELKKPHPIYQYLEQNGVRLRIYNNFVETGLRSIFQLVEKYPLVFNVKSPRSLTSIAQILRFLERVMEIAEQKSGPLSLEERASLKDAIQTVCNGKEGVSPAAVTNELRDILKDNMTTLSKLLMLIKRIGKACYRWHEKYLIVDHKSAIVGGMNIAREYLQGGSDKRVTINGKDQPAWRDSDVLLEGDVVADNFQSFRRNWLQVAGEHLEFSPEPEEKPAMSKKGDCLVSMIQHRPREDGDHQILNFLLYNLRTLKPGEKAWFETAYFLPRGVLRALQKEMINAAKRGVDVRILTNSETTSDFGPLVEASIFDVRQLLEASARVFYRNCGRMVHAKVMVLGDNLTMVGSWNCDNRSAAHDSEDVCNIYDKKTNQEMSSVLLKDMMEQSDEIKLEDVSKRNISKEIRSAGMLLAAELV